MAMKELPCELRAKAAEKAKAGPFCVKNCQTRKIQRIQSTHSAKSAMPMAFPSMKWILYGGEEFYAEIRRSTNGGGKFPSLKGR